MTESELLNEICCQQIYPTYLGIENEILNLLESLYEEDYIQKDDGCYKITTKGKQRIVYEFLVYQAENNNFFDQSIQDYFFEDNRETKIRKRDKFKCAICGQTGYDVHHIDYDKFNNLNENLITLCRSDHVKTNFNREGWIQFFKTIINERK